MRGDAAAYAALGLEPDADPAEIDRAYKTLIKLHHPDRQGGDAGRAAELNRAYRELRGRTAPDPRILDNEAPDEPGRSGWVRAAMVLIVALAALLVATGPVTALMSDLAPTAARPAMLSHVPASASALDLMDQPVRRSEVEGAVRDALRILRSGGDDALLNTSRDCNRALRLQPSVPQLDRCSAFDDAVVQLQDRDPTWDGGPFSQLAVTRRQWSAASALSNDYLAVDGRLDRIRLEVELALAPEPRVPAASLNEGAEDPGN